MSFIRILDVRVFERFENTIYSVTKQLEEVSSSLDKIIDEVKDEYDTILRNVLNELNHAERDYKNALRNLRRCENDPEAYSCYYEENEVDAARHYKEEQKRRLNHLKKLYRAYNIDRYRNQKRRYLNYVKSERKIIPLIMQTMEAAVVKYLAISPIRKKPLVSIGENSYANNGRVEKTKSLLNENAKFRIVFRDKDGNPLKNVNIRIANNNHDLDLGGESVSTDENGVAYFKADSLREGGLKDVIVDGIIQDKPQELHSHTYFYEDKEVPGGFRRETQIDLEHFLEQTKISSDKVIADIIK